MSNLYCQKCGYKNLYTLSPPNFCGGCGNAFSGAKPTIPQKTAKAKAKESEEEEEYDEDETDIDEVPSVTKFEYEVVQGQQNIFSGKDILNISEEEMSKINRGQSKNKVRRQNKGD
jgi:hypothetical protein